MFPGRFPSCTCFFHQLFQQVFLMFHLFPAFSSHFPVWNGHFSRSRVVPVPVSFVPIRHRGAGHRGAQRHGGGCRAGCAAGGGGGDHGAAGDGTHRLHLPQLGTQRLTNQSWLPLVSCSFQSVADSRLVIHLHLVYCHPVDLRQTRHSTSDGSAGSW